MRAIVLTAGLATWPAAVSGQVSPLDETVARISAYVEHYYGRAKAVVADETVTVRHFRRDMTSEGFPRRLVYELRVEWNPLAADDESRATITRQLLEVNGRSARPDQEPECLDPRGVSPEPLAFLLPGRLDEFTFTAAGTGRLNGQPVTMIDYRSVMPEPPEVEWNDTCASIELPGRARGRIWADPETDEIVRLDEEIIGQVDIPVPLTQRRFGGSRYLTIERAHTSTRYRPVAFADPDETFMLPASIETMTVITNSGSPRVRTTQTFGNYRRFVTASRIVR